MVRFVAALIALLVWTTPVLGQEAEEDDPAARWNPFIGVSLASRHFGAERDFEEFNPGLTIGVRGDIGWKSGEWGLEAGGFRSSYGDRAFYAGGYVDFPVVRVGEDVEGRLGLFFAYAEYPQLVDEADDLGVVTIGDFVPIISAQAGVRYDDRFELRARFGPGIEDSDVIVAVQAVLLF